MAACEHICRAEVFDGPAEHGRRHAARYGERFSRRTAADGRCRPAQGLARWHQATGRLPSHGGYTAGVPLTAALTV